MTDITSRVAAIETGHAELRDRIERHEDECVRRADKTDHRIERIERLIYMGVGILLVAEIGIKYLAP